MTLLFRRRRPPVSEPPVPCLRCALKDMPCLYRGGDVRCQRCKHSGEEVCVYQHQDLTRPEKRPTQQEQEKEKRGAASPPRRLWLSHPLPARSRPLQCMVYSLDPELCRDRRRLLGVAADMLQSAAGVTYVHGAPLSHAQVGNFVLPSWQGHGWRENREDGNDDDDDDDNSPWYRKHAQFFEGLASENAAAAARSRRLGLERRRERVMRADQRRLEKERQAEAEEGSG
ncbi:hypothetical protein UCDDA912_g06732 [Diaporthe ampelina]|uniref:Uncharacterized protein n=1 Tax=Diaporthe ampelina TaxID=1214573 RepID=A0A0G2FGW6_9PEZI|nr:hypothetical protein UCDDA912_g06732 [Diaporthe ampelina]